MNKRIMAKTMSAVTAIVMAASVMPAGVFAVDNGGETASAEVFTLPADGLADFTVTEYSATDEEVDALLAQTQSYVKKRKSRAAYTGAYDFSMGGSDYPRSVVEQNYPQLLDTYDKIDTAMTDFTNNGLGSDVTATGSYYIAVSVDVRDLGLEYNDENKQLMYDLMYTYLYANPQHYWNVNHVMLSVTGSSDGSKTIAALCFPIYEDMRSSEARTEAYNTIKSKIAEYQLLWTADMKPAEIVDSIHTKLCDETVYSQNTEPDRTHTLVGALADGDCVCEGYAKAFSLLCNLAGVPCFIATGTANGGAHAWNLVQLGDKWYYMDATWDDSLGNKSFYLCGSDSFDDHTFENTNSLLVMPENISAENYSESAVTPSTTVISGKEYYLITNAEELIWFAEQVNSGNEINGFLENDIDMNGANIDPIGIRNGLSSATPFTGTFNGNGHTVSNFVCNSSKYNVYGLFGDIDGGMVINLTVANAEIGSGSSGSRAGAIAGTLNGGGIISNCKNVNTSVKAYRAGGIVGDTGSYSSGMNNVISGCFNSGNISCTIRGGSAGGILGYTAYNQDGSSVIIVQCENTGNASVSATVVGGYCGGILGELGDYTTAGINFCVNTGDISSGTYPGGGILGYIDNASLTLTGSINYSDMTTSGTTDAVIGYSSTSSQQSLTMANVFILDTGSTRYTAAKAVSAETFASGEIAWTLGSSMKQGLGSEKYPSPVSKYTCIRALKFEGAETVYVNDGDSLAAGAAPAPSEGMEWVEKSGNLLSHYEDGAAITKDLSFTEQEVLSGESISDYAKMTLGSSMTYYFYCDTDGEASQLEVSSAGLEPSEATYVGNETYNGIPYAVYAFELPAKHIGDQLTAKLIVGGETVDTKTASAKDYLMELFKSDDVVTQTVAIRTLNYAAQAQIYKGYNTDSLANSEIPDNFKTEEDFQTGSVSDGFELTENTDDIYINSAALDMLSQTRVIINFTINSEKATELLNEGNLKIRLTCPYGSGSSSAYLTVSPDLATYDNHEETWEDQNGNPVIIGYSNGRYYIETPGISPLRYDDKISITFTDSEGNVLGDSLKYSVNDYISGKCESTSATGIAKLVGAMYHYSRACKQYAEQNNN